jgi:hypothetical protein
MFEFLFGGKKSKSKTKTKTTTKILKSKTHNTKKHQLFYKNVMKKHNYLTVKRIKV